MNVFRRYACLTWWVIFSVLSAEADLRVATDGKADCVIYAPLTARPAHRRAATPEGYLADYLKTISGADFTVQYVKMPPEKESGIVVGAFSKAETLTLPGDSWAYRTRADGRQLQLVGSTRRALFIAVFALLENQLGCRWWSANEENVPQSPTITLPVLNEVHKAVFRQTELMNLEASARTNGFEYKLRGVSTEKMTGSHTLYRLLAPYGAAHPEIYPMVNRKIGKRKPNKLHFCYTAPGIAEALAHALETQVEKRDGNVRDYIYFAGMGDWYGGTCQCDDCRKVYEEEVWIRPDGKQQNAPVSTLIRMINKTAAILAKKHPGIRLGTFAYMSMEGPPGKTVPADNVVVEVPHLRHCIVHGVDQCEKNKIFLMNLQRWCKLAPGRVYVWDYTVDFGENFLYPFPVIHAIADNIKLYARLGVAGIRLQGDYVSTGSDLVVLKNWVWSKLLWNPELDVDRLIATFCNGYYGPAAKDMIAYVDDLEQSVMQNKKQHLNEFARLNKLRQWILTDERMARLKERIAAARKAVAGKAPYARRVEEAAVSLEAVELWHKRKLVEKDGRLMQLFPDGPHDTYQRALHMLQNSRQASPREWGMFRSYHQRLLVLHGGPLVKLKRGDLAVEIAPNLGMRIRQIWFHDKPLLWIPEQEKVKGYPLLGGAFEQVNNSWRHGVVEGTPSATRVVMSTISESGWSVKQKARKTVELLADDVIRIHAEAQAMSRQHNAQFDSCMGKVTYLAPGRTPPAVECRMDGQWKSVTWQPPTVNKPTAAKKKKKRKGKKPVASRWQVPATKGVDAIRVTLPKLGCRVDERYPAPGVSLVMVSFSWNPKSGLLTTRCTTDARPVDAQKLTPWLEREICLTPLAPTISPQP